ncbi:hypothetical protein ACJMK2_035307 [Sinanodonta woodiana]|uniref:Uncharacterized protein n=1 Tax=Sinanodonta woodiana TaxID=1069815 RepID=A0ABD3WVZ4_SINWO
MFKKENIRKNFLRVKQIADQNLGRAEKSEVLSDDLILVEKQVDQIKNVTTTTVKKIASTLQGTGPDVEKRLMFRLCGDCQYSLALKQLEYEIEVEKNVIEPLEQTLDTDVPAIAKLKKQLNKVTLDMDSAKSRWHNAVRQTQVPGVNMATASAKADTIKDELEEAKNKVDQAKDALATEMFKFIAKEPERSQKLLALLEAQQNYHKNALQILQDVIPKMKAEHLRVTGRDIALVLEECICYLIDTGLDEEGLFRIAGIASRVKKLKASIDAGIEILEIEDIDQHTVAGALKQYLRELPEPLLTFDLYSEFLAVCQKPQDQRLQALWSVIDKLPKPNYNNFRYLIKFLSKLAEKSDVNKMTPSNIAIVIGPNLIWSQGETGPNMATTGVLSNLIELIIMHADWFFPGELDFHLTTRGSAPPHGGINQTGTPDQEATGQVQASPKAKKSSGNSVTGQLCEALLPAAVVSLTLQTDISSGTDSFPSSDITTFSKSSVSSLSEAANKVDLVNSEPDTEDVEFACTVYSEVTSPITKKDSQNDQSYDHSKLERTASNQSVSDRTSLSSQGTPSYANHEPTSPGQTFPVVTTPSPPASLSGSSNNLNQAPLADSEPDLLPTMRRQVRKPAPPPPPDRPFSVAVTASVKPNSQQFQTWPRQVVGVPQTEGQGATNAAAQPEKIKTMPPDKRSVPPEKLYPTLPKDSNLQGTQSYSAGTLDRQHHGHPERPKVPPPIVPGHHRSASTGAPVAVSGSLFLGQTGNENQGSQRTSEGEQDSSPWSQIADQLSPQDKLASPNINRQSIARPPRPMPPPPPPPHENAIVEETHL